MPWRTIVPPCLMTFISGVSVFVFALPPPGNYTGIILDSGCSAVLTALPNKLAAFDPNTLRVIEHIYHLDSLVSSGIFTPFARTR